MRILIAVPTFENIMPDTFKAIYNLDKGEHECEFDFIRGYDCATARNKIAQTALDRKADYVLMVDNDVVLRQDALVNLLEDPQEVCLGYYAHRNTNNLYSGRTCICKVYDEGGGKYFNYPLESEYTSAEMREMRESGWRKIRIHGGGMGCALIKADVFRKIKYPWYDWVNYAGKHRGMLSEDLFFCERCHEYGIPIYVDAAVECGHMLRHVQWCD